MNKHQSRFGDFKLEPVIAKLIESNIFKQRCFYKFKIDVQFC